MIVVETEPCRMVAVIGHRMICVDSCCEGRWMIVTTSGQLGERLKFEYFIGRSWIKPQTQLYNGTMAISILSLVNIYFRVKLNVEKRSSMYYLREFFRLTWCYICEHYLWTKIENVKLSHRSITTLLQSKLEARGDFWLFGRQTLYQLIIALLTKSIRYLSR